MSKAKLIKAVASVIAIEAGIELVKFIAKNKDTIREKVREQIKHIEENTEGHLYGDEDDGEDSDDEDSDVYFGRDGSRCSMSDYNTLDFSGTTDFDTPEFGRMGGYGGMGGMGMGGISSGSVRNLSMNCMNELEKNRVTSVMSGEFEKKGFGEAVSIKIEEMGCNHLDRNVALKGTCTIDGTKYAADIFIKKSDKI